MELTLQQRAIGVIYGVLNREAEAEADPLTQTLASLDADSLDVVEITMSLEDEFGIKISDAEIAPMSDVENGHTVGDWWRLIEPKLGRS